MTQILLLIPSFCPGVGVQLLQTFFLTSSVINYYNKLLKCPCKSIKSKLFIFLVHFQSSEITVNESREVLKNLKEG